ncbi:hypothetical protein [Pseudonocardia sp. TRM90224]|uniref:hypothetical protein n=1 Tax=Pseudonocardia sp. TRM90224 TaxID=2812678 RepID=UPI001E47C499|nr:hypothetical protein [Pseudonocardia sp. TRM90224]
MAATVALLAGCGGAASGGGGGGNSIEGKSPTLIARESPAVTLKAGTARVEYDVVMKSTFDINVRASGVYDFEKQIGEFETEGSGGGVPGTTGRSIVERNVSYDQQAGETKWRKFDASELVNTPVGAQDPAAQLALLSGISDDVREIGTERLRGDEVRHYAVTIDPKKLAAEQSVVVPGSIVERVIGSAEPIPADIFVDDDGRVRKVAMTVLFKGANLDITALTGGYDSPELRARLADTRTSMTVGMEYFDFGVPVSTQVPDASQVDEGFAIPPR